MSGVFLKSRGVLFKLAVDTFFFGPVWGKETNGRQPDVIICRCCLHAWQEPKNMQRNIKNDIQWAFFLFLKAVQNEMENEEVNQRPFGIPETVFPNSFLSESVAADGQHLYCFLQNDGLQRHKCQTPGVALCFTKQSRFTLNGSLSTFFTTGNILCQKATADSCCSRLSSLLTNGFLHCWCFWPIPCLGRKQNRDAFQLAHKLCITQLSCLIVTDIETCGVWVTLASPSYPKHFESKVQQAQLQIHQEQSVAVKATTPAVSTVNEEFQKSLVLTESSRHNNLISKCHP